MSTAYKYVTSRICKAVFAPAYLCCVTDAIHVAVMFTHVYGAYMYCIPVSFICTRHRYAIHGSGMIAHATQPGYTFVGRRYDYRYQPKGGYALRLGSKGRYGFCIIADMNKKYCHTFCLNTTSEFLQKRLLSFARWCRDSIHISWRMLTLLAEICSVHSVPNSTKIRFTGS